MEPVSKLKQLILAVITHNFLKNGRISPPTIVRSRSLVPGPSASKGAWSCHRQPVTALPRRTAAVFGGRASRITAHHWSNRVYRDVDALEEAAVAGWRAACLAPGIIRSVCRCEYAETGS